MKLTVFATNTPYLESRKYKDHELLLGISPSTEAWLDEYSFARSIEKVVTAEMKQSDD